MVDIAAIAGALQSLKVANDLVKIALGLRDESLVNDRLEEIRSRIWEAQEHALAAQATISDLLDERRELKRQLSELEDWESEKQRYELVRLPNGALAYAVKRAAQGEEPMHYACPTCIQKKEKSIMQPRDWANFAPTLECPVCKLALEVQPAEG